MGALSSSFEQLETLRASTQRSQHALRSLITALQCNLDTSTVRELKWFGKSIILCSLCACTSNSRLSQTCLLCVYFVELIHYSPARASALLCFGWQIHGLLRSHLRSDCVGFLASCSALFQLLHQSLRLSKTMMIET